MTINKIKGYRNYLNLTQEGMGQKLGISKQSYYNKETNKSSFTDEEKKKFNQINRTNLDIDKSYLSKFSKLNPPVGISGKIAEDMSIDFW